MHQNVHRDFYFRNMYALVALNIVKNIRVLNISRQVRREVFPVSNSPYYNNHYVSTDKMLLLNKLVDHNLKRFK